jgi:hypothetical protein
MPIKMPKPLPTIDLNNVNEIILEELELTNGGVAMAPSLKCLEGCYVTKEIKGPTKIKECVIK